MAERCYGQHLLESDGLNPHFFYLLSKENKRTLKSCEMFIPPTLMFDQGYVKAMFSTEAHQNENGESDLPITSTDKDAAPPPKGDSSAARRGSGSPIRNQRAFISGMNSLKPGEIKRKSGKDVDLDDVYESFTANCRDGDVAAVMLYAAPRSTDMNHVKFLDKADLKRLFFVDIDKPKCLLQQFIRPKGNNNFMVLATWTPLMIMAEGRRCPNALDARHLPVSVRGATFEDPSISTVEVVVNRTVVRSINDACCNMAAHFEKTERLSLTRFAGYFKVDEQNRLYLMYPTSIRMHEGDAIGRKMAPVSLSHAMRVTKQKGVVEDSYLTEVESVMSEYDSKVASGKMRIGIPSMMDTYSLIRHSVHGTHAPQPTSPSHSSPYTATSGMKSVHISGPNVSSVISPQPQPNSPSGFQPARSRPYAVSPQLEGGRASPHQLSPLVKSNGQPPFLSDPVSVLQSDSKLQTRSAPPLSSTSPILPASRVFPGGVRQLNPVSEARLVREQQLSLNRSKNDLRTISRDGGMRTERGTVGDAPSVALRDRSHSPHQRDSDDTVPHPSQMSRYNAKHPNRVYKTGRDKFTTAREEEPEVEKIVAASHHHQPQFSSDSGADAMDFVARVRSTLASSEGNRSQLTLSPGVAGSGVVLPPMFVAQEYPPNNNQGLIHNGYSGRAIRLAQPELRSVQMNSPQATIRNTSQLRPLEFSDKAPLSTAIQRKKSDLEIQHEVVPQPLQSLELPPPGTGTTWESSAEAKQSQQSRRDFRAEQVVAQASVAHILGLVSQQEAQISSWFTDSQREELENRTRALLSDVELYIRELSYAIFDMFLGKRCPVAYIEVPKKFQSFLSVQTLHSVLFKLHGKVVVAEDYLCERLQKMDGLSDILKLRNKLLQGLQSGALGVDWPSLEIKTLGAYLVHLREGKDYIVPNFANVTKEEAMGSPMWTPVIPLLDKEIKSGKTLTILPLAAEDAPVSAVTADGIIRQRRAFMSKVTGRARASQVASLSLNTRPADDEDALNDAASQRNLERRIGAERRRLALLDGFDSGADESDFNESSDEEVRNLDSALVSSTIAEASQFLPFDSTIKQYNRSHALVVPILDEMGLEVLKSECAVDILRDAAPFLHPTNGIVSYFAREHIMRKLKREQRNQKEEEQAKEVFFRENRSSNSDNAELKDLEAEFNQHRRKRMHERRRSRRRQRHMLHRHIEALLMLSATAECERIASQQKYFSQQAKVLRGRSEGLSHPINRQPELEDDRDEFQALIASSQLPPTPPPQHDTLSTSQPASMAAPPQLVPATLSLPPQSTVMQAGPQINPLDIVCSRCHKCRVLCVCHKVFRSLSKNV